MIVHINGRPLHPPAVPLTIRSRALLPARAVFQALGATVDFDPRSGRIQVRRGLQFLSVALGSRTAYVANRPVALDVAPLARDGVTYLPLRFVAEALGGEVRYFPQRDVVDIEDPQATGSSPARAMRDAFPVQIASSGPTSIDYRHPAPGEFVTGGFPSISALFRTRAGTAANVSTVSLFLDGQDVSRDLVIAPGAVAYSPANALAPGVHQIAVHIVDAAGHALSSIWSFAEVPLSTGAPPGVRGYEAPAFTAQATEVTGPGATLQFALATTVPGTGFVTLCGYSRQYPLVPGNDGFHYYASITPPTGFFAPACQAAASFTDRNGSVSAFTLATPLRIDTRPRP